MLWVPGLIYTHLCSHRPRKPACTLHLDT